MSNKALVPEAKQGLNAFKNEVAMELGVPFKEYNGDLTSRHQKIYLSLQKGRCSNASSSFINKFNLIQYN